MKNIKKYVNIKKDLELAKLQKEVVKEKEEFLKKEKENILILENQLEMILQKMEESLKELKGIEKELLYEIIVKGSNVTKAVDKVAFNYDMDVSGIWKNYYPKVKEKLQEIEKLVHSSENQV